MFHLVGWRASVNNTALAAITALADPTTRVSGNDIVVPASDGLNYVVGEYFQALHAVRAQLRSPSQARTVYNEIYQSNRAAAILTNPNFVDLRDNPMLLDPAENLEAWTLDDAAGAENSYVLAWLANGRITPVMGDIRTVRVTSATTLVANVWSNCPLTFDQSLPAGRYQVVGARFHSAGMIAFRCVFLGYQWRPGALGQILSTDIGRPEFRHGRFGVWGEFTHLTPPSIDVLSTAADTAETGVLDIIKVG